MPNEEDFRSIFNWGTDQGLNQSENSRYDIPVNLIKWKINLYLLYDNMVDKGISHAEICSQSILANSFFKNNHLETLKRWNQSYTPKVLC